MLKRLERSLDTTLPGSDQTPPIEFRVAKAAQRLVSESFAKSVSTETVLNSIAEATKHADETAAIRKEDTPPESPIACRAGCAHCCYTRVPVTAPEVILLAQFVRAEFSESELQSLKLRLDQTDEITHGMSDEEHVAARVPCPLLKDNHCSAYDARPLECQGFESMDAGACRDALKDYGTWNVPVYFARYSIFKNTQAGLLAALVGAGYRYEVLELTAALKIALDTPNVAERWLSGENIFADAALPPSDPEFLALQPWTPTFDIRRM